ncbi:hypothetical protein [Nocardia vinacea]|uniref:hypothetical protein n=1 Tax=Nocardia vinacea TaxID=96468 RepID=UPI000312A9CD|nr:hypothetical protein [Nocardia vinacea]
MTELVARGRNHEAGISGKPSLEERSATGAPTLGGMSKLRCVFAVLACTSIDGRPVVVTAGYDQTTRIWDLTTMTLTAVIDYPALEPVVAVSPGADIILGLGNDIAVLTRQP